MSDGRVAVTTFPLVLTVTPDDVGDVEVIVKPDGTVSIIVAPVIVVLPVLQK